MRRPMWPQRVRSRRPLAGWLRVRRLVRRRGPCQRNGLGRPREGRDAACQVVYRRPPPYRPLPGQYNGAAGEALGTVREGTGQEVRYSLDGDAWSGDAPTATDAGEYTVRWRVTAGRCRPLRRLLGVHREGEGQGHGERNVDHLYNGQAVQANTVAVSSPASGYALEYGTSTGSYGLSAPPSFTDAGSHTVYYRVTAPNYEPLAGTYKVDIAKASCALSISPKSLRVKEGEGTDHLRHPRRRRRHQRDGVPVPASASWPCPARR